MDFVTRQFIVLTKKLRKELRKALADMNGALHKQTEAIRKSYQAGNDKQGPSPEVTILNKFPEGVEVHQNKKDARNERDYRRAIFFVTALSFAAIVVYADLVYLQYQQMVTATVASQQSAADADKTLIQITNSFVIEQRPYVTAQGPTFEKYASTGSPAARVAFTNVGKTPAKSAFYFGYMVEYRGLIKQKPFAQFIDGKFVDLLAQVHKPPPDAVLYYQDIAPSPNNPPFVTPSLSLDPKEIPKIAIGDSFLVVYGFTRYRDSFGNVYQTDYCSYFYGPDSIPWHLCPNHNTIGEPVKEEHPYP